MAAESGKSTCSSPDYDVLVIGRGPARCGAALQLGRSLKSVLICDNDEPRNGPVAEAHGYLTRNGISPEEFRRLGREEVGSYGGEFRDEHVTNVEKDGNGFTSTLNGDEITTSRKVVLVISYTISNESQQSVLFDLYPFQRYERVPKGRE